MTGWFAPFIFYLARCTENELRRQVELLKAENEILRKRVPKKRIFLAKEERELLVKLGTAIGPGAAKLITVVCQRSYQRWVRAKNAGNPTKEMGRPKTADSVKEIVIRLAKETCWGYARIVGELRKLRINCVPAATGKNILKEAGVKPGPERRPGSGTWNDFLKAHVDSLWQIEFFSKLIWTPTGLNQAFVLAFLHVGTRRVFCSPCCFAPGEKWMVSQAHACIQQAREAGLAMTYLIHDRDGMYVAPFDQVFKDAQCRVIRTAPQAPNQNAFIERWVRSIGEECLNHFLIFGQKHFDYLVACYLTQFNEFRPHQGEGIGNRPIIGTWPDVNEPLKPDEEIVCIESLGGILKRYERRAA